MKTLLCVIAAISFLAMPILAEDVKLNINGDMAVGYMDNGAGGNVNPGTFGVPRATLAFGTSFNADTSAVLRLNFDNAAVFVNNMDRAYIKIDNVIKNLAKNDMVNPVIYVGLNKVNFGEETFSNNVVENALVQNSIGGLSGIDTGIEFRQNALPIELPVTLGYSLSFMNGASPAVMGSATDDNNVKAYALKVMATMKSLPMYFSLSQYGSGTTGCTPLSNEILDAYVLPVAGAYVKANEINVRFDLLEGAQKFDATKSPLFADAKGVFRLSMSTNPTKGTNNLMYKTNTMMIDGIYNVDKQWYVAARMSSLDFDGDKFSRMSIGGGHRLSDKAILKLDYTTNTEPAALMPKVENDSVSLLMTVIW